MRDILGTAKSIEVMKEVCRTLKERVQRDIEENGEPDSSVIPYWRCQPYIRSNTSVKQTLDQVKEEERSKEVAKLREMRKAMKKQKVKARRERTWDICVKCEVNPKGLKCLFDLCRTCCRIKVIEGATDCRGHRKRLKGHDATTLKEAINDLPEKTDFETGRALQTEMMS